MAIAALILSVLALIMATASVSLLIAQKLSTHRIEMIDPEAIKKMEEEDRKIDKAIRESDSGEDEWI